jgi:transposase
MARPERLGVKEVERAAKLHAEGVSIREIARRFEVSKTTLQKVLKKIPEVE